MNFSDETVNAISHWAGVITLVCVVASALAAVLAFWSGGIKESRMEASISHAQAETNAARAEMLALKTPRSLSNEQTLNLIEAAEPFAGQRFSGLIAPGGADSRALWVSVADALKQARWIIVEPDTGSNRDPRAFTGTSTFEGIEIVIEYDAPETTKKAAQMLAHVLSSLNLNAQLARHEEYIPPQGETDSIAGFRRQEPFAIQTMQIQIGTKPVN